LKSGTPLNPLNVSNFKRELKTVSGPVVVGGWWLCVMMQQQPSRRLGPRNAWKGVEKNKTVKWQ
jgi:hypothetical protein